MKSLRILTVCTAIFMMACVQAQDVKFGKNEFYRTTTSQDDDTVSGTTTAAVTYEIDKQSEFKYKMNVGVDSLTADSVLYIMTEGSINGVKFYPIDTISWHMTSADTTVLFDGSTAVRWKDLRAVIKGTDTGTRAKLGDTELLLSY